MRLANVYRTKYLVAVFSVVFNVVLIAAFYATFYTPTPTPNTLCLHNALGTILILPLLVIPQSIYILSVIYYPLAATFCLLELFITV